MRHVWSLFFENSDKKGLTKLSFSVCKSNPGKKIMIIWVIWVWFYLYHTSMFIHAGLDFSINKLVTSLLISASFWRSVEIFIETLLAGLFFIIVSSIVLYTKAIFYLLTLIHLLRLAVLWGFFHTRLGLIVAEGVLCIYFFFLIFLVLSYYNSF